MLHICLAILLATGGQWEQGVNTTLTYSLSLFNLTQLLLIGVFASLFSKFCFSDEALFPVCQ